MVDLGKPQRRASSWLPSIRSRERNALSTSRPRASAVTKCRSALALTGRFGVPSGSPGRAGLVMVFCDAEPDFIAIDGLVRSGRVATDKPCSALAPDFRNCGRWLQTVAKRLGFVA